jgi:putative membrane protein
MAHGAVQGAGAVAPGVAWSAPALLTGAWDIRPEVAVPLLLAGGACAVGWWRLSGRGAEPPRWRAVAAAGALVTVAVALMSPLEQAADASFAAHMLQHVLLITVAAPLLLLADQFAALLWALPHPLRTGVGRLLRPGAPLRGLCRRLTAMPVAWPVHALVLWLWHLPIAYDAAVSDRVVHDLEHLAFFLSALLFWWPVIGPAPRVRPPAGYGGRMVYLVLGAFQSALLGLLLTLSPRAWYQSYASVEDQSLGGVVMWGVGGALDMLAVLVLMSCFLASQNATAPAAQDGTPPAPRPAGRGASITDR